MAIEEKAMVRLAAALLIFVGALLLAGSFGYWRFREAIANPGAASLPKSLAGLPLSTVAYGPEAVAEITRLHGKEFPITSGAMGMYGSESQATLWVAGFPASPMAAQIVAAMQEKIAQGNSPFTPTGQQQDEGRTVYQLDGMGQKHVYFQSGSLVIWLAANPPIAEKAIQQILEVFP
jgi:hypothetical protein